MSAVHEESNFSFPFNRHMARCSYDSRIHCVLYEAHDALCREGTTRFFALKPGGTVHEISFGPAGTLVHFQGKNRISRASRVSI